MIYGSKRVAERRPLVGVLCCNRVVDERAAQTVSNRFIDPLIEIAGVSAIVIPAMPEAIDATRLAGILDGLLLTGSCSNLHPGLYGGKAFDPDQMLDQARDEVALMMADRMISAGKPVFGICRGLQELNVLFGGTLHARLNHGAGGGLHHAGLEHDAALAELFDHYHDVEVAPGGYLSKLDVGSRMDVNSVHCQGIERLGHGLAAEAIAPDGLVEGISARPCGGLVLGVQWHPEWDLEKRANRAFFDLFGAEAA